MRDRHAIERGYRNLGVTPDEELQPLDGYVRAPFTDEATESSVAASDVEHAGALWKQLRDPPGKNADTPVADIAFVNPLDDGPRRLAGRRRRRFTANRSNVAVRATGHVARGPRGRHETGAGDA